MCYKRITRARESRCKAHFYERLNSLRKNLLIKKRDDIAYSDLFTSAYKLSGGHDERAN